MRRTCLRFSLFAALGVWSGCASDSTGAGEVLVVSQVDVQPPGAGLIIGATQQFTATPRTSSGIPVPNRQVTWSTSDQAIATVSNTGLVTAMGLGEVTISARVDGATGSRPVNVTPKPVARILVEPTSATLFVNGTVQLEVATQDADGEPLTGRTIQYASDNSAIATISNDGLVTGVAPGQTLVRAASEGKEATSSITVNARPATKLGFISGPANGVAGQALTAIQVAIQDETGGTVTGSTAPVTVALAENPGSSTLGGTLTVNAVAGVATFSTLVLNRTGTGYTLRATSGSLTQATSGTFAIIAGPAAALAITQQPPGTTPNGAGLNPQPVIQIQDAQGNPVSQAGVSVTADLMGSGGTLGGTPNINTNANGVAAYTNLSLSGQAGTYQLRFTAANLTAVTSGNITLSAASLAITTQPSPAASSGTPLPQQPVVRLVDAQGTPVSQGGVVITAAVVGSGATLNSPATATTNASGVASFSGLTLTGKVGSYQLSFSAPGVTSVTSTAILLAAGPPSALLLATAPPASGSTGVPLSPQPAIQLVDASGNPVMVAGRTITAALGTTPGGGSPAVSGASASTNGSGRATFTSLAITGPLGTYTLRFQSTGLTETVSGPIAMLAGPPARIEIITQPPNSVQNGEPWSATPAVRVEDANDNPVPGVAVIVVRSAGSSSGVLGGTLTQTTGANGQASFPDLSLAGPLGDYRIRWSVGNITSPSSREFTLTAGPPARLGIVTQPSATARNDQPFPTQPVIQVQDVGGNPVAAGGLSITAAIASGGGTLTGNPATTGSNGRAIFSGLKITGGIGVRTLQFSSGTLQPVTSASINLLAGTATRIVITTQPPATIVAGQVVVPNPVVDLEDVSGNNVDSSGVLITVSQTGAGSLGGTLNRQTNSSGQATFNDLRFNGEAGTRTLSFAGTGLQSATSNSVEVTPMPSLLVVTTQPPSSARSGIPLSTAPVVQVRDAGGSPVPGVPVSAALVESGSVSGTTSGTSNAQGNVTFTGLTISGTVGTKTLRFSTSVSGVPAVNANALNLTAGPAAQLGMATQPGSPATNGVNLLPQPVVRLLDAQGNALDSTGASVTAELVQGTGTLNGTKTVQTNGSGQAVYSGLDITGTAPGPFVIRFTAGSLTPVQSAPITLQAAPAASLTITQQPPSSVASGATFAPAVLLRDAQGNPVSGVAVTVSIGSGGGNLSGIVTRMTDPTGTVTFTGLAVNAKVGTGHTLKFTSGSLNVTSDPFSVTVGAPAEVRITTQPSGNADDNEPFERAPVVEVRDSGDNLVSGVTVTAILLPQGLASGNFICCDTAVTGANGRATFTGIGINRTSLIGNDFRIRFTAGGVQSSQSSNIEVN